MVGDYPVCYGNTQIGKVVVRREGLYYRIQCRCRVPEDAVCRLRVRVGQHQHNLGVLIPEGKAFRVDTKIPVKRFGEGEPVFTVTELRENLVGKIVPVYPEEPFAYISRLKNAYLVRQNQTMGILMK